MTLRRVAILVLLVHEARRTVLNGEHGAGNETTGLFNDPLPRH